MMTAGTKKFPDGPSSLFVCGRLCLFGEHSDWAAEHGQHPGRCLVIGTEQGLRATAVPDELFTLKTLIADRNGRPTGRTRQMSCPATPEALLDAAKDQDEFFRYCAGVAHCMAEHPGVTGGLRLEITAMDLPLKKGVSSSAAVCILVAKAFDAVYGLNLFPHELMEAAYRGERVTGSQCGRMDQVCIYGQTPVLLTFQAGAACRVEPIFPAKDIHMFFVDLAGAKDTVQILADLQGAYDTNDDVQRALGPNNDDIVRQAYRAMSVGDGEALGCLMDDAQRNFDQFLAPHSPEQLASRLLHELLGLDALRTHVFGGKGVGSQGDGTAQFVARSMQDRDAAMALIAERFPQMQCLPLTIHAAATAEVPSP